MNSTDERDYAEEAANAAHMREERQCAGTQYISHALSVGMFDRCEGCGEGMQCGHAFAQTICIRPKGHDGRHSDTIDWA